MPRRAPAPDLFNSTDAARAAAYRAAAETARNDPHYTLEERDRRARYYAAEADRIDPQHPPRRR